MLKRLVFVALLLGGYTLHAESPADAAANEGIWQGYDGEWRYVSRLLVSIAEGDSGRQIRLAATTGGTLGERSDHAYRPGKLLPAQRKPDQRCCPSSRLTM